MRFEEATSGVYRRAVNRLAESISGVVEEVSYVPYLQSTSSRVLAEVREAIVGSGHSDEAEEVPFREDETGPGWIEAAAAVERHLPSLVTSLGQASTKMSVMTRATEQATAQILELNEKGSGFGARLEVLDRLADQLIEPAAVIREIGEAYARGLVEMSPGYLTVLDKLAEELIARRGQLHGDERLVLTETLDSIREASSASTLASASLAGWIVSMDETASLSRRLRLPLNDAQAGLRGIIDGGGVIDAWAAKAEAIRRLL